MVDQWPLDINPVTSSHLILPLPTGLFLKANSRTDSWQNWHLGKRPLSSAPWRFSGLLSRLILLFNSKRSTCRVESKLPCDRRSRSWVNLWIVWIVWCGGSQLWPWCQENVNVKKVCDFCIFWIYVNQGCSFNDRPRRCGTNFSYFTYILQVTQGFFPDLVYSDVRQYFFRLIFLWVELRKSILGQASSSPISYRWRYITGNPPCHVPFTPPVWLPLSLFPWGQSVAPAPLQGAQPWIGGILIYQSSKKTSL